MNSLMSRLIYPGASRSVDVGQVERTLRPGEELVWQETTRDERIGLIIHPPAGKQRWIVFFYGTDLERRDRHDERGQRARIAQRLHAIEEGDEDLLREILELALRTERAQQDPAHHRPEPAPGLARGARIALQQPAHERGVVGVRQRGARQIGDLRGRDRCATPSSGPTHGLYTPRPAARSHDGARRVRGEVPPERRNGSAQSGVSSCRAS